MLFDERGRTVATAQHEHRQITPRPGWVEHDAGEILARSRTCIDEALAAAGAAAADVAAIGIANQRETVVLWERETRPPARERDRLAGHAQRRARRGARLPRPLPRADGPAARDVLLGPEALVAARRAAGRARARRGRRARGGHDRQLARLAPGGRPRHRRDQREPHAADGSRHARLGRRAARRDRRPARAAPRHRAVERRRRRDRRHPAGLAARRPAGGALRAVLLRAGRGQVHLRHRQLPPAQHRRAPRAVEPRADHRHRLPPRRGPARLHAGGRGRRHGSAHPVAARQPRGDRGGGRGRGARRERARQRRLRDRAGLLRPLRAALAPRRPRRDLRPHAVPHQGASRARRARRDRVRDARAGRRDEGGCRRRVARVARRRRHDRQRAAAGDPGRRSRAAGRAARRDGDHRARRRLRSGSRRRLLGVARGVARE